MRRSKAYFALKLAGCSVDAPFMQEARANIMRLGGIPQMNTFSKLYLALLGQFPVEISARDPGGDGASPDDGRRFTFTKCRRGAGRCSCRWRLSIISNRLAMLPGEKQLHELYPLGTEQSDLRLPRERAFLDLAEFLSATWIDTLKFLQPLRIRAAAPARAWKKRSAGCWNGLAKGAMASRRCFRRC